MDNTTEGINVNVSEVTQQPPFDLLVFFGPTNPYFDLIHYSALVCLFISIIISIYTLIFLARSGHGNIFKRKIGERLVVYLAIFDLLISVTHSVDHLYWVARLKINFEPFCVVAGLLLQAFSASQAIIVVVSALSAFLMVSFSKRISFGKCDWALLATSIVIPVALYSTLAVMDWLGPSGYWCQGDMRKPTGPTVYTIFSSIIIATFVANIIFYLGIWLVIKRTAHQLRKFQKTDGKSEDKNNYTKTARILVLFVVAYIAQWWPLVVYTFWSYVETPHISIIVLVVISANMGGVFNFVAYTFVRKRSREDTRRTNETSTSNNTSVSTVS